MRVYAGAGGLSTTHSSQRPRHPHLPLHHALCKVPDLLAWVPDRRAMGVPYPSLPDRAPSRVRAARGPTEARQRNKTFAPANRLRFRLLPLIQKHHTQNTKSLAEKTKRAAAASRLSCNARELRTMGVGTAVRGLVAPVR
eukprot:3267243-Prymnesium_polylepis.3